MRDQIEAGVTHTESNNYHKPREINHRGKEAHFVYKMSREWRIEETRSHGHVFAHFC